MATALIHAGAANGFLQAVNAGRSANSPLVANAGYAAEAAAALKFADQVVTAATAITFADADSTYTQGLVQSVAAGMLMGRVFTSVTATDYATVAAAVAAAAKAAVASP